MRLMNILFLIKWTEQTNPFRIGCSRLANNNGPTKKFGFGNFDLINVRVDWARLAPKQIYIYIFHGMCTDAIEHRKLICRKHWNAHGFRLLLMRQYLYIQFRFAGPTLPNQSPPHRIKQISNRKRKKFQTKTDVRHFHVVNENLDPWEKNFVFSTSSPSTS